MPDRLLRAAWTALMLLCAGWGAQAQPAQVVVGSYVTKVQDVSFKDNKYALDFYLWFRWKAEGALADYKPLDSFELINGKIDNKSSVVEKKIGDLSYASVRVSATVSETWDLKQFPFDSHRLQVHLEDSAHGTDELVFVPDVKNSRLGDELNLAGWLLTDFKGVVSDKVYQSNYGDTSLPSDARSEYSRYSLSMDMDRTTFGTAWKLLSTVLAATAVAFVAFMVKPSDLDPRFGLGVGALFAVAASAFVVSSSVPDSGVMTIADEVHMVAIGFIFLSLLQSAFALKLEVSGREPAAVRLDHWSLIVFPVLFFGWAAWMIGRAIW
ncbi:MAG: hypothetical protein ABIX46_01845 [Burkholderiaceae bacterium]